jgi:hypothetical protein
METRETITLDARAHQRLLVLTHVLAGELDVGESAAHQQLSTQQVVRLARVVADGRAARDSLAGLRRIGIDEISYRRGQRYLTVSSTTPADAWSERPTADRMRPSRRSSMPSGPSGVRRSRSSAPMRPSGLPGSSGGGAPRRASAPFRSASWPGRPRPSTRPAGRSPNAARRHGETTLAEDLKGARFVLWKNPEHRTERQRTKLASTAATNEPLYGRTCSRSGSGSSSAPGARLGSSSSMAGRNGLGAALTAQPLGSPWEGGPATPGWPRASGRGHGQVLLPLRIGAPDRD